MVPNASAASDSPIPAASVPSASSDPSKQLHLPILVFGAVEVRRLQRELEALESSLQQEDIRKVKTSHQAVLPRVSRLLDALASENNCSLLKQPERQLLQNFLAQILASAPGIHMSFASDPSAAFMAKIVAWLRSNVHPNALLQIGLQPSIAAGCIVRTSNKVFDLSLRQHFETQKAQFTDALIKKATA
ncbi:MAG TPA: hypothetical protein VLG16_03735 [Candidatus Saccharimonadales bacterium]|nr:hypothetical protein [Candidatus Saccharimonadales bacterium]